MGNGKAFRTSTALARVLLALVVATVAAAPAHADLHSAYHAYQKGDYAHAFQGFLALAKLGQPQSQLTVAQMYEAGRGTEQSDIHAYAWANLSAANGETDARALADKIRPMLAPGSERIAGWLTQPYTHAALERTLLPDLSSKPLQAAAHSSQSKPVPTFKPKLIKAYLAPYPTDARRQGIQGWVFVELTVMLDGLPRFPRILYADPPDVFDEAVKESVLRTQFSPAPQGATPLRTAIPYRYTRGRYANQPALPPRLLADAKAGGPQAELLYGLLLDSGHPATGGGLPWLVKAAQAGLGTAQYEIGRDLLAGVGCRADEAKALRWLRMAADQGQPNAEILLTARLLHGTPSAADVARARALLERPSGEDMEQESSHDAQLLLAAILAATPQPALRDPRRALELLRNFNDRDGDPTPLEIRAAAQAAEGDFPHAVASEKRAIRRAHSLKWDLSPLEARLVAYQAGKPWYGNLLDF